MDTPNLPLPNLTHGVEKWHNHEFSMGGQLTEIPPVTLWDEIIVIIRSSLLIFKIRPIIPDSAYKVNSQMKHIFRGDNL